MNRFFLKSQICFRVNDRLGFDQIFWSAISGEYRFGFIKCFGLKHIEQKKMRGNNYFGFLLHLFRSVSGFKRRRFNRAWPMLHKISVCRTDVFDVFGSFD